MTFIKDLQTEHGEIHELFWNLEIEMKNLANNNKKAESISNKLNAIKDRIINHLMVEEEKLYPILLDKERSDGIIDKENSDTQILLEDFLKEQKEIGDHFIKYIKKYSNPKNILADYHQFYIETAQIFSRVQSRIELEEKKLFPLFQANKNVF